jgi:pimeloyl-ACP methyl ester carboxylesterase
MGKLRALVLLLLAAGLAACSPASTPAPLPQGKVNVGDHELFYRCTGSGSPTVVVEAGFGGAGASGRSWDAVASGVQKATRFCVYDRAPLGLSRASLPVRTADDVAQDLHRLLVNAHIEGPYVLVAHSYAGIYARSFIARYPDDVTGLVLMDAISPDFYQRMLGELPPASPDESRYLAEYRREMAEFWAGTSGSNSERLNVAASMEAALGFGSLGDLPLVAVSHTGTSGMFSAGLPGNLEARLEQMWVQMVQQQALLSTNGSFVQASKAGHDVQQGEPQLVIDAILKVVEEARNRAQ